MNSDRWQQLKEIFWAALEKDPGERAAFLDHSCSDPSLRREVESLLALLARLRDQGKSIVLISHKLEEITAVCDRVTVLRNGQTVATRELAGLDASELGRLMVGDALPPPGRPPQTEPGPVALSLSGVGAPGLAGIDLELRAGEILALAGIDGNGQGPKAS